MKSSLVDNLGSDGSFLKPYQFRRKESEEMEHEELNLETKIKKKQEELERMEKRLRSLDNVRPQFLEEQDKLEKELQRQYDIYMEKYRTLDYLENELEQYHKAEEERKEEHDRKLKRMREKLLKEEVEVLRGNRRDDADEEYRPPANSAGRGNAGQGAASSANSGGYVFICNSLPCNCFNA